ncbi:hypothetical protein [uncultured Microbacterium sp.]|uniref:Uncharacterized protein n=1 Tax=uncultured Microbacterium sp. TaxID=191216 RepID=A0A1Y5NWN7_9MICO|nr:hypothetical protein [uncultured Microbacterium sp.]SBS70783.1 hypothetical protein MIPYR_10649 [uncultured Microbacterium sp.]
MLAGPPPLTVHGVMTVYLDAMGADLTLAPLNGVSLAVHDGGVDPAPLLYPALKVIEAAIDYAAERLGEDRDSIIFDLRQRIAGKRDTVAE